VLAQLLSQFAYCGWRPQSSRQKAQEERKKADEKANDEAYKALMKRLPNSDRKVDSWGGMRAPSTDHDK
jgi:hypothetical protein